MLPPEFQLSPSQVQYFRHIIGYQQNSHRDQMTDAVTRGKRSRHTISVISKTENKRNRNNDNNIHDFDQVMRQE